MNEVQYFGNQQAMAQKPAEETALGQVERRLAALAERLGCTYSDLQLLNSRLGVAPAASPPTTGPGPTPVPNGSLDRVDAGLMLLERIATGLGEQTATVCRLS